jgi:hypothetical protein
MARAFLQRLVQAVERVRGSVPSLIEQREIHARGGKARMFRHRSNERPLCRVLVAERAVNVRLFERDFGRALRQRPRGPLQTDQRILILSKATLAHRDAELRITIPG